MTNYARWRRVAGPALRATCVALVTCAVVTTATKLDAWGFATAGSAFVLLVICVTDAFVTTRHLRALRRLVDEAERGSDVERPRPRGLELGTARGERRGRREDEA